MKQLLSKEQKVFIKKIIYFLFLQWFLPVKTFWYEGGRDDLFPWAPYSIGGMDRDIFLEAYHQSRRGNSLRSHDYQRLLYGSAQPTPGLREKIRKRSISMYRRYTFLDY